MCPLRLCQCSTCSPFGGIPRNWKPGTGNSSSRFSHRSVPPSGGSLEIGNTPTPLDDSPSAGCVPPSGGSLEIGNTAAQVLTNLFVEVPPSGGSLEIGNWHPADYAVQVSSQVPPSGGSLEIGNLGPAWPRQQGDMQFPLRGDP